MYEIGQQVVCVESHPTGIVKEGDIRLVKNLQIDCVGKLNIDIGLASCSMSWRSGINRATGSSYLCGKCKKQHTNDGIWWLDANRFRPLDDLYNTEIEELMNEVNEKQPFEV